MSESEIGCSLAEAAERKAYEAWLRKASATANSMHVVYINTSLVTKALSHASRVEGFKTLLLRPVLICSSRVCVLGGEFLSWVGIPPSVAPI